MQIPCQFLGCLNPNSAGEPDQRARTRGEAGQGVAGAHAGGFLSGIAVAPAPTFVQAQGNDRRG